MNWFYFSQYCLGHVSKKVLFTEILGNQYNKIYKYNFKILL